MQEKALNFTPSTEKINLGPLLQFGTPVMLKGGLRCTTVKQELSCEIIIKQGSYREVSLHYFIFDPLTQEVLKINAIKKVLEELSKMHTHNCSRNFIRRDLSE